MQLASLAWWTKKCVRRSPPCALTVGLTSEVNQARSTTPLRPHRLRARPRTTVRMHACVSVSVHARTRCVLVCGASCLTPPPTTPLPSLRSLKRRCSRLRRPLSSTPRTGSSFCAWRVHSSPRTTMRAALITSRRCAACGGQLVQRPAPCRPAPYPMRLAGPAVRLSGHNTPHQKAHTYARARATLTLGLGLGLGLGPPLFHPRVCHLPQINPTLALPLP